MSDGISKLRCMWERQEGPMRKVPGVTTEAIEAARGPRTAAEAREMYGAGSWQAGVAAGLIEERALEGDRLHYEPKSEKLTLRVPMPPTFTKFVVVHPERIQWIEDDDPGDMDRSEPVHVRVMTVWRRAGE